ncbi:hypothetical protein LSTR_LSTR002176 [Laodelphax striatellus]|uniref:Hydroxysteroid dehydrogenase-like protein 2 n=1 Tax=Laodelphax striatellus TaxID=195883 RepID=A0A482XRJ4_LAOST|nr:hypothetical protein LSTR_LSTR002176 [Laodelphax striatellus]
MINTGKLAGRTIFISGASRGIGKAIALKAAQDGANIIIAAKTGEPHPKLEGTIYTAAKEVEAAGGKALPCVVDVRDENQIKAAVDQAVSKFGGIDIVVNNASAISLTGTLETDMKRYDLMHHINTRGTFLVSKICLPYLKKSPSAHILNLSPPLNMSPHWFKDHLAYTMAKYGMSMCVLGMAEEFRCDKVAVNALWPRTAIQTAAIEMLTGPESSQHSRKPEIVADAAYAILCKDPCSATGNFYIDEDVLRQEGMSQAQIDAYACDPSNNANLMPDFFLDVMSPDKIVSGFNVQVPVGSKTAGKEKTDASSSGPSVELIFKSISDNLSPELVSKTQAIFQFHVTGKLKPAAAFMTGKLKISGNLQKAMKLEKLMTALKAKL